MLGIGGLGLSLGEGIWGLGARSLWFTCCLRFAFRCHAALNPRGAEVDFVEIVEVALFSLFHGFLGGTSYLLALGISGLGYPKPLKP